MAPRVPSTEAVVIAWLRGLQGLAAGVATTTPSDVSTWAANGFVVVLSAGGSGLDTALRAPVVSVDTWAIQPDSDHPPWGKAFSVAQDIIAAVQDMSRTGQAVQVTPSPGDWVPVLVQDVSLLTEPRRIPDPDTSRAHTSMDLEVRWTAL